MDASQQAHKRVLNKVMGHRGEGGAIEYVGGEVTLGRKNTKDNNMLDFTGM